MQALLSDRGNACTGFEVNGREDAYAAKDSTVKILISQEVHMKNPCWGCKPPKRWVSEDSAEIKFTLKVVDEYTFEAVENK